MSQRNIPERTAARIALFCVAQVAVFAIAAVSQTAPAASKPHAGYFVDPSTLHLATLLAAPPALGSPVEVDELALLHLIESTRTPAQSAAAKADDAEQDIFSFRNVLGPNVKPEQLPLTTALSAHVHGEEGAASDALKSLFARPRPYQLDKSLHPICKVTDAPNSYPSGHTLSGYLLAFTLAEMLPEKKIDILARADEYAHNRLVCGVHYPSDLEASRLAAYAVFGLMMSSPRFLQDLDAARTELRARLGAEFALK